MWSHPDLLPTAADLDDPLGFQEGAARVEALTDDEFDAALADLLDREDGPDDHVAYVTALRDDALATLRAWHAPDPGQERLRQSYVDHLDAQPDGTERDCHPAHLTAGALVLSADRTQVLLTLHAKARRWFHLGGHCEPGDATPGGGGAPGGHRGVRRRRAGPRPGAAAPRPSHGGVLRRHEQVDHLDVRFLALAPEGASPTVSDESIDVRWWPVGGLPTDDPDMHRMVELALARAQTSSAAI